MRYSHKTTHTIEARSFSRPVSEAKQKIGLLAGVRTSHGPHPSLYLCERADQLFFYSFSQQPQIRTETGSKYALANRTLMAAEATTEIMMLKPVGVIASAGLTATQSNREVTKTNTAKTPYPEAQSIRANRRVAVNTNFGKQTSNRMRCIAS